MSGAIAGSGSSAAMDVALRTDRWNRVDPAGRTERRDATDRARSRDGEDDRSRAGFALALLAWLGAPEAAIAAVPVGAAGGTPEVAQDRPAHPAVTSTATPTATAAKGPSLATPLPEFTPAAAVIAPTAPAPTLAPAAWPELVPMRAPSPPVVAPDPARAPVAAPLVPAREDGSAQSRERRGESGTDLLRAARRIGRPTLLPPPAAAGEIVPPGTKLDTGSRASVAPTRLAGAQDPADAPAMRAWEARIGGRAAPGEPVVVRLEDDQGGTGSLRLHLRGEELLATLRTADPALAGRLGRDLGELQQSLRERGVEPAVRIQISGPGSGAGVETERREPGRGDDSARRHDERSPHDREEDEGARPRSRERNPR